MQPRLLNYDLYLAAIGLPGVAAGDGARRNENDVARNGLLLKSGQKVDGLTMTFAKGAAALLGRVASADSSLPPALHLMLIPAEKEKSDDVLRFFEVPIQSDGRFFFPNIPPGKYWLYAQVASQELTADGTARPFAWDANQRALLRRNAQAWNQTVELGPCQRIRDYSVTYTPPPPGAATKR